MVVDVYVSLALLHIHILIDFGNHVSRPINIMSIQ